MAKNSAAYPFVWLLFDGGRCGVCGIAEIPNDHVCVSSVGGDRCIAVAAQGDRVYPFCVFVWVLFDGGCCGIAEIPDGDGAVVAGDYGGSATAIDSHFVGTLFGGHGRCGVGRVIQIPENES